MKYAVDDFSTPGSATSIFFLFSMKIPRGHTARRITSTFSFQSTTAPIADQPRTSADARVTAYFSHDFSRQAMRARPHLDDESMIDAAAASPGDADFPGRQAAETACTTLRRLSAGTRIHGAPEFRLDDDGRLAAIDRFTILLVLVTPLKLLLLMQRQRRISRTEKASECRLIPFSPECLA